MNRTMIIISFLIIIFVTWIYLSFLLPTTIPYKAVGYFISSLFHPHQKMNKQAVGFLTYWRMDDIKYIWFDLLTEINYFSLSVDKNGEIITIVGDQTNPGWREWQDQSLKDLIAQAQVMGEAFTFTVSAHQNDVIKSILDNKDHQQALINAVIGQIKSRKLNGVNIDFEYTGDVPGKYKQEFTGFAESLSDAMHNRTPGATLSLSIMPLETRNKSLFDLPQLVPLFDRFIGMSYDYYGANSDIAGPVAPMNGFKENKFFFDVTTTYSDYEKYIPKNKIIMGIPYYGWDWAVEDGKQINSKTFPSTDQKNYAAVESYARMLEDKNIISNQCQWDDYAKASWCWYTDPKTKVDHQVWLENNKSIGIKYDFANQQNFAGTAIWVLGYDKDYPDLWTIIKEKFTQK